MEPGLELGGGLGPGIAHRRPLWYAPRVSAGDFDLIFGVLQGGGVRYLVVGGVAVASIEDLVALKRVAGRPKDLEDIRVLEAIAREEKHG